MMSIEEIAANMNRAMKQMGLASAQILENIRRSKGYGISVEQAIENLRHHARRKNQLPKPPYLVSNRP